MTLEEIYADRTITTISNPELWHKPPYFLRVNDERNGLLEDYLEGCERQTKPFDPYIEPERSDWWAKERLIGNLILRWDGQEKSDHEVGDEMYWTCPITGTQFEMERMSDGHFWFRLSVRQNPDGEEFGLQCGVFRPEDGDRLRLLVEIDGDRTYFGNWKKPYKEEEQK